ncbi:hypothetical protein, partial [Xanthovirga aplysinae]|uniref:hypothetical protein n=1 Tax=Xanthovirga aplysinae TaxID=2529853 RepID=UPI001656C4A4
GIFVLSTHRAIKLARREGYKATMKAGVCALDTLCADLGVDPCHPGMQMHEATDCLIRHRKINPSLHVVLWQVGLIGELGFKKEGYLNNNFSYFIGWLQKIYGEDYQIIHYIGSRYPTIDPLIELYSLKELHYPENQEKITGLSTFYITPRDVVSSHYQTIIDLGVLSEGQPMVLPKSPLREIGTYRSKEMKAFDEFANFKIPPSYKWQKDTAASNFLIELRFDTKLQELYRKDPLAALNDTRFSGLSDKERALLASRDSGSIQIASKGIHIRSIATEKTITTILNSRLSAAAVKQRMANENKNLYEFKKWLTENKLEIDWDVLHSSIARINRNNLFPWTGVYIEPTQKLILTLIGHKKHRLLSIVYVNGIRIENFKFVNGTIRWKSNKQIRINGFIKPNINFQGKRQLIGKIWEDTNTTLKANNFVADEVDPKLKITNAGSALINYSNIEKIYGSYYFRARERLSKHINRLELSDFGLKINQQKVENFNFNNGVLTWDGG